MTGIRRLFLANDQRVFKVAHSQDEGNEGIEELANQRVLEVILYYETRNKKPYDLLVVEFDRLVLSSEGKEAGTCKEERIKRHHFFGIGFKTAEDLAAKKSPLSLPSAPIVPTLKEKEALYKYIEENLPSLSLEAPLVLEMNLKRLQLIYQNQVKLIKEAMKIRNGKR
ncbi:hypothetical protein QWY16_04200 [Planococcus shenhongbingii]|uniref:Uncharacterized protein n=1 Tax=Planococcus shenhongbingii TaxID=3058398 RepID=A0ABT8NEP5_9BACL|nr:MULTISPECIES: hypothetical protein [unclassified Planococcus (in: firmicutes)]MDN7246373.1 hypothetical protein [Planococcus sp. N017]WKA59364.1 hypothetical protein QWY16_04200 [Planococcus sp. N016]